MATFEKLITSPLAQDALDIIKKKQSTNKMIQELHELLGDDMPTKDDVPWLLDGIQLVRWQTLATIRSIKHTRDVGPESKTVDGELQTLDDLRFVRDFLRNLQVQEQKN